MEQHNLIPTPQTCNRTGGTTYAQIQQTHSATKQHEDSSAVMPDPQELPIEQCPSTQAATPNQISKCTQIHVNTKTKATKQQLVHHIIVKCCNGLGLPQDAIEHALSLFSEVVNNSGISLKSGGTIDNCTPLALACVHCASIILEKPKTIYSILKAFNGKPKENSPPILMWVKKLRAIRHDIPMLDPSLLVYDLCLNHLGYTLSFAAEACSCIPIIMKMNGKKPPPSTVACSAVLLVASKGQHGVDEGICQLIFSVFGVAPSTMRRYVQACVAMF